MKHLGIGSSRLAVHKSRDIPTFDAHPPLDLTDDGIAGCFAKSTRWDEEGLTLHTIIRTCARNG